MERYLTKKAYERLKKELKELETTKRKEVAKQLRHAASFGDLSENAAYDDAKDAKSFLEGKIAELRELLFQAKIVEKGEESGVQIGSKVFLAGADKKFSVRIVVPEEINVSQGKISYESPFGKALLGRKKGDLVNISTPTGQQKYKIEKIEY